MSKTPAASAVGDLTPEEVAGGRLFIWFAGSAVPDCARDYLRVQPILTGSVIQHIPVLDNLDRASRPIAP